MQGSALCRSRRELSNEYLLAKIGVDTAENEPLEVWGKSIQYYSFVSLLAARTLAGGHGCTAPLPPTPAAPDACCTALLSLLGEASLRVAAARRGGRPGETLWIGWFLGSWEMLCELQSAQGLNDSISAQVGVCISINWAGWTLHDFIIISNTGVRSWLLKETHRVK